MRTEIPAKTVVTCDRCKTIQDDFGLGWRYFNSRPTQEMHFCSVCAKLLDLAIDALIKGATESQSTSPSAQEARAEPIMNGWLPYSPSSKSFAQDPPIVNSPKPDTSLAKDYEWRKVEVIPAREEKA